jgi:hypothetical protein
MLNLGVTPAPGSAGQSLLVVGDVTATARTATGALVRAETTALTTADVSGIAGRGLVVVSAGPVVPTMPVAAPLPAIAPAPAAAALPRTGTGLAADSGLAGVLPSVSVLVLTLTAATGIASLRRRARPR